MKASIDRNTGLLIESQSHTDDVTLLANALNYGFANVEIRNITKIELDMLIASRNASQMTQADKFAEIERAFDKHIDDVAEARGYGRVGVRPSASCIGFAGFQNQWQLEAIKFAQWSADCCARMIQGQNDVIAGTRPIPTPEQAIAELPIMVW